MCAVHLTCFLMEGSDRSQHSPACPFYSVTPPSVYTISEKEEGGGSQVWKGGKLQDRKPAAHNLRVSPLEHLTLVRLPLLTLRLSYFISANKPQSFFIWRPLSPQVLKHENLFSTQRGQTVHQLWPVGGAVNCDHFFSARFWKDSSGAARPRPVVKDTFLEPWVFGSFDNEPEHQKGPCHCSA